MPQRVATALHIPVTYTNLHGHVLSPPHDPGQMSMRGPLPLALALGGIMLCLQGLQMLFHVLVVFYRCFELFNIVPIPKGTFRQLHMILDQLWRH